MLKRYFTLFLILILGLSVSSCGDKEEVELPESKIEMWHLQSISATHISFSGDIKLSEVIDYINQYRFNNPGGYGYSRSYAQEGYDYYYYFGDGEYLFFDNRMSTKGIYRQEGNNIIFDDLTMKGELVDGELFIVTDLRAKTAEYLGVDVSQLTKVEMTERYLKESKPSHLP